MKAFLITSPKFNGSAEVLYNTAGVLCRIDTTQTDMDATAIAHFKRVVAPHVDTIGAGFSPDTIIVESSFEVTFEMWFNKYDYKLDKERARKLWEPLPQAIKATCYFGVDAYDRFLKRKKTIEKMYPKTFLSTKAWETEWDKIK